MHALIGILASAQNSRAGGGGAPANALYLNGEPLTLNGQTLTLGA